MKKNGKSGGSSGSKNGGGYGRPPKDTQFKKGKSGNPSGRPKGAKNKPPSPDALAKIIEEEGFRLMQVKDGGKSTEMPVARVIARKLNHQAASGDTRSQKIALENLAMAQEKRAKEKANFFELTVDYKVFWEKHIQEIGTRDIRLPPGYPHPDTLLLNFETREVTCLSRTPEEDELFLLTLDKLYFYQTALMDLAKELAGLASSPEIVDDLHLAVRAVAYTSRLLGLPWNDDHRDGFDHERIEALERIIEKKLKATNRL